MQQADQQMLKQQQQSEEGLNFSELASLSSSCLYVNQEDFSNSSSKILQLVQQMQQNLIQFSLSSAEKEGQEYLDIQCQIINGVNKWRESMFDVLQINITELSPALSEDITAIKAKLTRPEFSGQVQFVLNQMQAMDFLRLNYKDNASKIKHFLRKTQQTLNYELASDLIKNNSLLQIYFTYDPKNYNNQQTQVQNSQNNKNYEFEDSNTIEQTNCVYSEQEYQEPIVSKNNQQDDYQNFIFEETTSEMLKEESKNNYLNDEQSQFDYLMEDTSFLQQNSCCFEEENIDNKTGIPQYFNLVSFA